MSFSVYNRGVYVHIPVIVVVVMYSYIIYKLHKRCVCTHPCHHCSGHIQLCHIQSPCMLLIAIRMIVDISEAFLFKTYVYLFLLFRNLHPFILKGFYTANGFLYIYSVWVGFFSWTWKMPDKIRLSVLFIISMWT